MRLDARNMEITMLGSIKKISKTAIFAVLVPAAILTFLYINNSGSGTKTKTIELKSNGFIPQTVKIKVGDTVTFVNKTTQPFWPASNLHPTHLIYSEFDSKEPIGPGQSWSFIFDEQGSWKFHDHLAANFTGKVIVQGDAQAGATPVSLEDCKTLQAVAEKQKCWDDVLELTLDNEGLDKAFAIFGELYQSDPEIPKACHGWSHVLGKAAYDQFAQQKDVILRKETSYCGYGFFHGFIERLLQESHDLQKTKEFCDYASAKLKNEARGVYYNCVHGIGHGSVDIEDSRLWGNFQAMIRPGLDNCESIFENSADLRTCVDGAFNAMQQYVYRGEYDLVFNRDDLFSICRDEPEQYKESCYFEFVGLISDVTKNDFQKASDLLLQEKISAKVATVAIRKMSADFMQNDIVNPDYQKNIINCRRLAEYLRIACTEGIAIGLISHGEPSKEYVKGLDFCKKNYLTENEKNICYQKIVGQLVPASSDICQTVPESYRKYCY